MEKITRETVGQVTEELRLALVETIELDEKAVDIKLKQAKAQKRLSIARDAVRNLKL